jgi:hypothetical protein
MRHLGQECAPRVLDRDRDPVTLTQQLDERQPRLLEPDQRPECIKEDRRARRSPVGRHSSIDDRTRACIG